MNAAQYIREAAQAADLNDESSMFDALELIQNAAGRDAAALPAALLDVLCSLDMSDPSEMYDMLILLGASHPIQKCACGADLGDGEGFNGQCGNCADRDQA